MAVLIAPLASIAKSAHFKRVYDNWSKFRTEAHLWFSINETRMDLFMQSALHR
jgi:TRAP-type mannitol/chloroaromatic compound transport system substrate-binding protein